ncbi:TonB-dependent receptor domain-containing protein [Sphingomonas swuensis]
MVATPAAAQDAETRADTTATQPANVPVQTQNPDCPDQNQDGVCDPASTLSNADTSAQSGETVVVTGSRIRRDEFSTTEPLTVITAEEITQSGFNSATDALQSAAVTQGASQINNAYGGFVTDGGTGANTLGLRGLGPARTLILLNGRRLAPGGTRGSVLSADLNVLPTAIIERVEVLKAGASSIYGSDAIAGVVNIITDRKLTGLSIDAQVNVPELGDGVDKRIAATFGIQAPRLSVIGSVEYRKRAAIARNQSKFLRCPIGGFLDGEGSEFGSGDFIDPATGEPKCFTLDNGGVTINTLGIPTRDGIGRTSGLPGRFNRFVPAPGQTTGPFPGFLGVGTFDRDTFDPRQEFEPLITGTEIMTGYLATTYDFGYLGNSELYGEVLATRRKSSSPLYRQLALDYLTGSPLLPANIRNGILANPTETSSGRTVAARAFIGYGLTDSRQKVDYVRASGGIRGDFFFNDWRYDLYFGKSWNDGQYEIESFLTDRIANSTNVVQNADGSFSCASQASNRNCVAAPALSAAVIGGQLPQDFRDYITDNTIGNTSFRETTASFGVDGPLFSLPGGEVQLALGAEYRKQSINDQPDQNSIDGNLFGLTAGTPTVGKDSVREIFGELYVPIVRDKPFLYRLNVNGSVRYTDYKSYGGDTTYKIAGEWEPVRGLGFRGSYGTSYRAPALAEQFLGATSGFLGSDSDPCSALADPSEQSPTEQRIAANCAAIGLPADFEQRSGITVFRVGGAQAGLEAETSKNWSIGVVGRPPIPASIGQLSLALDYFNIKVENGVSDLSGDTILNRCYSAENFDPTAGFCRFVQRDSNNALTVTSSFVNLSESIVKGYEFNGRFSTKAIGPGTFIFNANVTKYTEQSSRLFPEEFLSDSNGIVTSPDWVGNFDASYSTRKLTFRYGLDWIGGDRENTYKFFAFDNLTGITDPELVQLYKDNYYLETKDYFLHNASVQFDVSDRYEFTLGVRNLFDKAPPRISAIGFSTIGNAPLYSGYDLVGRTFFANVNFKL